MVISFLYSVIIYIDINIIYIFLIFNNSPNVPAKILKFHLT